MRILRPRLQVTYIPCSDTTKMDCSKNLLWFAEYSCVDTQKTNRILEDPVFSTTITVFGKVQSG